MEGRLKGSAFGDIHWTGKDPKLESSSGEGSLRIIKRESTMFRF